MDERQVVAATYTDEWHAALARETLMAEGIPCVIAGGFTGNFRAEAPGRVKLMVRAMDLERAEEALKRRREEAMTIDWSEVDVGELANEEGGADAEGEPGAPDGRDGSPGGGRHHDEAS
jgi:hypothetical protein